MTRKRLIVISVLTGVVVLFVLFSPYGVVEQQQQIKTVGDSLRKVVHRLEHDTTEIERIARERYGYIREGEEVYLIDRDTTEDE